MNSDSYYDLRTAISQLLARPVDSITLERITTGLSHNSFKCNAGGKTNYFVKVYNLGPEPGKQVEAILRTIETMRNQGVPAPELVAYSVKFPNVVVQRFVDANVMSWDNNLIAPVAKLYCDVVNVSLPHPKFISTHRYLDDLQFQLEALKRHANENKNKFDDINLAMVELFQTVKSKLEHSLPDEPLLVLTVHDDFSEKNILASDDQIELLCDWDSFRNNVFVEHFACSVARFSTEAPMQGTLDELRLKKFMQSVSIPVRQQIGNTELFAQIFPFLAILRHLRLYRFRYQVVTQQRNELMPSLLQRPMEHCQWMLEKNAQISNWMGEFLSSD